jgi:sugar phosphate isomerase/epimerase
LLIDYYHLRQANEDPGIVLEAGSTIRHLHFAEPIERGFPLEPGAEYETFFSNLRQIGYAGRCSIEAYTQNFAADAKRALTVMRTLACPTPKR